MNTVCGHGSITSGFSCVESLLQWFDLAEVISMANLAWEDNVTMVESQLQKCKHMPDQEPHAFICCITYAFVALNIATRVTVLLPPIYVSVSLYQAN